MNWLGRAKKYEPVKLARTIKALLAALSLLGYIGLTQAEVGVFGAQLEVILPALGAVLWPIVESVSARWLRSKVASPATAETLAKAAQTSPDPEVQKKVRAVLDSA